MALLLWPRRGDRIPGLLHVRGGAAFDAMPDLPARFGDFRVVHTRPARWSKTGGWQRIFAALAQDADNKYAMIDATIVRAHQYSAGAKEGIQTSKTSDAAEGA